MPIIDGIFCFIHTSEGPLQEFPCIDGPQANSATVYVLARDGQQFSIKCNAPSPYKHMPNVSTDALAITTKIDGVDEIPIILDHEYPTVTVSGTKVLADSGNWELRKFMFSSVELTEERGGNELTLDSVNKLGEIVVTVRGYQKTGVSSAASRSGADSGRAVIHEKSIKGRDISHSVQRAKGEYCAAPTGILGIYSDTLMTFRFLYKSERALKGMGLIEHSPTPPPNLRIEPRNTNPSQSRPPKNEQKSVKRERDDPARPSGRNKIQRRQNVILNDIETIDLTGDDR